jgi:hypothetical protein
MHMFLTFHLELSAIFSQSLFGPNGTSEYKFFGYFLPFHYSILLGGQVMHNLGRSL